MRTPSFTLKIDLGHWSVGKTEAAQALLKAFQEAGDQSFPDESLRRPSELAMATIEMDEETVTLKATCRMAAYEVVADALIEGDGGIKKHVAKRGGWPLRVAVLALAALGRVDWEVTAAKTREHIAQALALASAKSLKLDAEENIKSMETHLGIH